MEVWVDSSFRSADQTGQCGYVFVNPNTHKEEVRSTEVFSVDDSNSSERDGAFLSVMELHKDFGYHRFLVHTDNIVVSGMLDTRNSVPSETYRKHPKLLAIRDTWSKKSIVVHTQLHKRSTPRIKKADRASKAYRKW